MKPFKNLRIGIVMAGGGAKGAYEAGALKAIAHLGVTDCIKAISGTSIGAVNAAILATVWDNEEGYQDFWNRISPGLLIGENEEEAGSENGKAAAKAALGRNIKRVMSDVGGMLGNNRNGSLRQNTGLLSMEGLREFGEKHLDFSRIRSGQLRATVCAVRCSDSVPCYFDLGECADDTERLACVLASAAIPYVFPPVSVRGELYSDGGMSVIENGGKDNMPVRPLVGIPLDLVIVMYLREDIKAETQLLGNVTVLELHPTVPLEPIPQAGTMDFRSESIKLRFELGYNDMLALLSPWLLKRQAEHSGISGFIRSLAERGKRQLFSR